MFIMLLVPNHGLNSENFTVSTILTCVENASQSKEISRGCCKLFPYVLPDALHIATSDNFPTAMPISVCVMPCLSLPVKCLSYCHAYYCPS